MKELKQVAHANNLIVNELIKASNSELWSLRKGPKYAKIGL